MKRWTPHWDVKSDPRSEYFEGMLDGIELVEQAIRNARHNNPDRYVLALVADLRKQVELGRDGVKP